jgi:hypothetical protein
MLQANKMGELVKWAQRASSVERFLKLKTARVIVRSRRLTCQAIGCKNRDNSKPCTRCGARGRAGSRHPAPAGRR